MYSIGKETLDLENAPYGGFRFPIDVHMAGRRFATFSVDIAAGDTWFEPHDELPLHDWLGFAGIPGATIPVISIEQQFAEKLHAYTQLSDEHSHILASTTSPLILSTEPAEVSKERVSPVILRLRSG